MFVRICLGCGRETAYKNEAYFLKIRKKITCKKCAPRVGNKTTRSEETRKRMSEAQKSKLEQDPEYRKKHAQKNVGRKASDQTRLKMSENRKGEGNSFFGKTHSSETRQKISEKSREHSSKFGNPFLGKVHTEETRKKMSNSRAVGIANGTISNTNGFGTKSWYESPKTGERVYCDSLLEKFRMIQLDNDSSIQSWTKKHGLKIQYEFHGKFVNFIPDFLLTLTTGEKIIEEVKGFDIRAISKRKALEKYCENNNLKCRWIEQHELEIQGYRQFVMDQS